MKLSLRLLGFTGFALFACGFAGTFISPLYIEKASKDFIRSQVESQVRDKIEDLEHPTLEAAAALLSKEYQAERADLEQKLKDGLPRKIAEAIGQMQDLSCECRKKLEVTIHQSFEWRITSLDDAQVQLNELIQGKYVEAVKKLLLDLRIFTGVNALVFLGLLAVSLLKGQAAAQLFLPGGLLAVATLFSAYFYLFEQNWFFTLIYNDYVGYSYICYVAVVFLALCDVVLNRARVTTRIANGILDALGQAASLSPC